MSLARRETAAAPPMLSAGMQTTAAAHKESPSAGGQGAWWASIFMRRRSVFCCHPPGCSLRTATVSGVLQGENLLEASERPGNFSQLQKPSLSRPPPSLLAAAARNSGASQLRPSPPRADVNAT